MTHKPLIGWPVGLAAWVIAMPCGAAQAATPKDNAPALEEAVSACRAMADDRRRLACYDTIRLTTTPGVANNAAPTRAAPVPAVAPAMAPATPAATAPAAAAATREFGLPPAASPAPVVHRVSARLQGRFADWAAGTRLALDNGQVWLVVDGQGAGYALDRPQVTIERGLLGSFFATVDGVSASIKVRRLQ